MLFYQKFKIDLPPLTISYLRTRTYFLTIYIFLLSNVTFTAGGSGMRNEITLANALTLDRPSLGNDTGVALFRMLRLVAYEDIMGRAAGGVTYYAGKKLGASLGITRLEEFIELCKDQKIGRVDIPMFEDNQIYVDIYECVTCSGLEPMGRTLCHFEGGLIAGVVEKILGRRVQAIEKTCIGGLGHESCGFELTITDKKKPTHS